MLESVFTALPIWALVIIIVLVIWEVIWKGFALWKASRNNQLGWFIAILVLNTAGILPILYIYVFSKGKSKKKKRK